MVHRGYGNNVEIPSTASNIQSSLATKTSTRPRYTACHKSAPPGRLPPFLFFGARVVERQIMQPSVARKAFQMSLFSQMFRIWKGEIPSSVARGN
jgi:hypothetical protein